MVIKVSFNNIDVDMNCGSTHDGNNDRVMMVGTAVKYTGQYGGVINYTIC
jgi:hypothetical protein